MPLILLTSSPMLLRRGWVLFSFRSPNLAATHPLDQVAIQTPSSKRKTTKQVTFQDPLCKIESHTSSKPPDDCHGKRKTTVLNKGEEALVSSLSRTSSAENEVKSSHYKTISATTEVKVGRGNSVHSRTIPLPKAPNSPASKTIRHSTPAIPPLLALASPFSATQRCSHPW